jgi:hypothetical protein
MPVIPVGKPRYKQLQDVVSQAKLGEHGQANVIDAQGHLIFPEISLVLDNTNMAQLAQARAGRTARAGGERCKGPRTSSGATCSPLTRR